MGSLDELGIEVVLASSLVGLEIGTSRVHSLDEVLRSATRFQLSYLSLLLQNDKTTRSRRPPSFAITRSHTLRPADYFLLLFER